MILLRNLLLLFFTWGPFTWGPRDIKKRQSHRNKLGAVHDEMPAEWRSCLAVEPPSSGGMSLPFSSAHLAACLLLWKDLDLPPSHSWKINILYQMPLVIFIRSSTRQDMRGADLGYCFGTWEKKQNACRKQKFNHLGQETQALVFAWWTSCLVHSYIWLQVIAFWGGPYRFTWFRALAQHNWTLPY